MGDPLTVLNGYETDQVAQLDSGELCYQWFDFVFKGRPKPDLLKNKVNYAVMGVNAWRHVPALEAGGTPSAGLQSRTFDQSEVKIQWHGGSFIDVPVWRTGGAAARIP